MVCATIQDRRDTNILSVRDQTNHIDAYRQKRLVTLLHLFLIHRYKISSVHYVTPTDDSQAQSKGMQAMRIYSDVHSEVGHIIVASVNEERMSELLNSDEVALKALIAKS
jgi:isocitrate lyase